MKPKLRKMTKDIPADIQIYIYYGKPFKNMRIRSHFVTTLMNHLKRIKLTNLEFFWEMRGICSSLYTERTEKKNPPELVP